MQTLKQTLKAHNKRVAKRQQITWTTSEVIITLIGCIVAWELAPLITNLIL
jgi:hypothetical protein